MVNPSQRAHTAVGEGAQVAVEAQAGEVNSPAGVLKIIEACPLSKSSLASMACHTCLLLRPGQLPRPGSS
jgi:hypothetical protein